MKSSQVFCRLLSAASILACAAVTSSVHASSAPVILDLEGNTTCSSLVANDVIFEYKDTSPPIGVDVEETLTLHNGQTLTYSTNGQGDTIMNWQLDSTAVDPAALI